MYEHLKSVSVAQGAPVTKGQQVAAIGDANGYYTPPSSSAHLHWEMRKDLNLSTGENPYQNPLTIKRALQYITPSLFVSDRRTVRTASLGRGQWTYLNVDYNAPSSTAFVERFGTRHSLNKAVTAGWIHGTIYRFVNNVAQPYSSINSVFFEKGYQYAVYTYVDAAILYILVPRTDLNDRRDRARRDMLNAVSQDARFSSVMTDHATENLAWSADYELRTMEFNTTSGITSVSQATYKTNPLIRYTSVFGQGWKLVDWNTLQ